MSFWIKYESSLPTKPEVAELANILSMSRYEVVGRLMVVWAWANEQTQTGHARSVTESFLDELHGARGFAKALQKVGWLRITDKGISFPHFDRHMSQTAKRRALTAVRVKRCRNADVTLKCAPEKRREEKSIKTPLTPRKKTPKQTPWGQACVAMSGDVLKSIGFRTAWESWLQDRADRKKPLTPRAVTMQIRKLEKLGHDRAVAAIEHSIAGGYQGIFEPSGRGPGTSVPTNQARPTAPAGKYLGVTGIVCDSSDVGERQDVQG